MGFIKSHVSAFKDKMALRKDETTERLACSGCAFRTFQSRFLSFGLAGAISLCRTPHLTQRRFGCPAGCAICVSVARNLCAFRVEGRFVSPSTVFAAAMPAIRQHLNGCRHLAGRVRVWRQNGRLMSCVLSGPWSQHRGRCLILYIFELVLLSRLGVEGCRPPPEERV